MAAAHRQEAEDSITVSLDGSLSDRVASVCRTRAQNSRSQAVGGWDAAAVAQRLARSAEQLLRHYDHQIPTKDLVTRIRISSLTLASTDDDGGQVAHTFLELAAAATLLEQRASGKAPPGESIVLAMA
jgi:hypothetical protein